MNFIKSGKLSAYIRLSRLNNLYGAFLLLLPSYWSLAINNHGQGIYILLAFYVLFLFGAISMRSFGCIINDMADMKIDKQVKRTQNRPLANGDLSMEDAFRLLVVLGFFGLFTLVTLYIIKPSNFAVFVGLSSLVLVVIYPFSKRFFHAPQLILGLTFNWGILLADALLNNEISINSMILYGASIIWTIAYDTIYAYQDYEDDKRIGVKSTAQMIGKNPQKPLMIMYLIFIFMIIGIGNINDYGYVFFGIVIVCSIILLKLLKNLDYKNAALCGKFFKQNVYFAIAIWIAFLFNN